MITKEDLWWLETVKVGDRLEVQPYWNESTRTEQLHGPLEVVAVRRTGRCQSGALISVKAEGHAEPTCLDAAWFIGPYGNRKFKGEDEWWRSERTVTSIAEAEKEVERLRSAGWRQADFAKALRKELE